MTFQSTFALSKRSEAERPERLPKDEGRPMKLADIIPWGRSFDEYRAMFALSQSDLTQRILGCGDGPASFNAEANAMGLRVVSVDPIYEFTAAEIESRVEATFATVLSQCEARSEHYVWDRFPDIAALGTARREAMRRFAADFEPGKRAGRYVVGSLPHLPFTDSSFDLALASHLLFLYSNHLSLDRHLMFLRELLRVAAEVRVFPLLNLTGEVSRHLAPVSEAFRREGCAVEEVRVDYEFMRGGHTMLRLRRG